MSLKLIHKELSLPVERMLQGLAYYMAFNECTQGEGSTEGTYVEEAQKKTDGRAREATIPHYA